MDEETKRAKHAALTELAAWSGVAIENLEDSEDFHEAVRRVILFLCAERDDCREKFELLQGRINIPVGREPAPWESNPDYKPGGK